MNSCQVICTIVVMIGALCMLVAIITSVRTLGGIPPTYRRQWQILIILMSFFLAGYLAFILILNLAIPIPIDLITVTVFLGGACFVLLVLRLTKAIINNLREREHLLEEARGQLEEKVRERTLDLEHKTQEHILLAAKHADLNVELQLILNSTADGIRIIDHDMRVVLVNSTFSQMIGTPAHELIGQKCYEMNNSTNCHTNNCLHHRILAGESRVEVEADISIGIDKKITCLITAAPFQDKDGKVLGIIESFRDISARKAMEERLRELSITDEMTGLLNRRGFLKIATQQLEIAQRLNHSLFLLYADIDDFKQVNDTLGHDIGDEAIKEVAALLCSTFRKADVIGIGRLGGDEFSVLMFSTDETSSCNHPAIMRLDTKLHERNQSTTRPYQLSISTGIVQYDRKHPQSITQLLSAGDQAMYECKQQRKSKSQS